jgi:non-lysosomal glucosylceramidase
MQTQPTIPSSAWKRPIGLGWSTPYKVRYPSNLDDGPWHGAPLGGFGAGCIGRSHRGDFNLWHLDGGEHIFQSIPACQFSVFEQVGSQKRAYALSTEPPSDGSLNAWNWYPASQSDTSTEQTGIYHALYPRSWFVYDQVLQAQLTCEQFSPIWPDNYCETSYPVAVFVWTAHNPTDQPMTLSLMLTWQNLVGWFTNTQKSPEVEVRDDGSPVYEYEPHWGQSTGSYNYTIATHEYFTVVLSGTFEAALPAEGEGEWAIAVPSPVGEVSYHTRWNPSGDGAEIWQSFASNGSLPNCSDKTSAGEGEQIAAAIAVQFTLQPGETREIPFVLAWDLPVTEFAEGITYFRRYTDFFGRDGRHASRIAQMALQNYTTWQQQIQTWQQPILARSDWPDWFKMALFNELYHLTQGGTLWTAATERDPVGQFAGLECIDYRWYESLDVRLYGSFALLFLFPELEKSVIRAFARAIPTEDDRQRVIGYFYTLGEESPVAVRKAAGATPHDLGAPNEHVWEKTNYTSYQDCNLWKDLPCDFVLQVYRDYLYTDRDVIFLEECWDAIAQTLSYLKCFDYDYDGIPENGGAPDQTFDDWKLQGISAYCGGLWIAALEAAIVIGRTIAETTSDLRRITAIQKSLGDFQVWLEQARSVYHDTLWTGKYYRLDSDSNSDIVMTDQLCGQFYAHLLKLPDVVHPDLTRTTLETIYNTCFLKFNHWIYQNREPAASDDRPIQLSPKNYIGAANGVRPDGSPEDPNATHPLEIWVGINFGLSAFLVQTDMQTAAMEVAESVVKQIYNNGLQFRTPEAITASGTFRACHYLRATAIWALYGTLVGLM